MKKIILSLLLITSFAVNAEDPLNPNSQWWNDDWWDNGQIQTPVNHNVKSIQTS